MRDSIKFPFALFMLSVISFSCFSSFQLPKLVAERIAVKSQLDAIFSDPIAQVIIQKEESLSNMMASLFLNVKRFNEIKKIAPNENKGALESNKNSMLYTLWQLVCNPLKNPLKRLIVRELHPLKRALSSDYFNATNMGSFAFVFEKNEILKSYVLKLSQCNRLETAEKIISIIKKLKLKHVSVPSKFLYEVPNSKYKLVIAERINKNNIVKRELTQFEINEILTILIILDYYKIPLTDLHNVENILKLKDGTCVLIDTESFWEVGSYVGDLSNTRAFLNSLDKSYQLADIEKKVDQIIEAYLI